MSRGIKDLRELICVSRLTVRDSDDELQFSDDEGRKSSLSRLGQTLEVLHLSDSDESSSRQGSANSRGVEVGTPDSGIGTNGNTPLVAESENVQPLVPCPPADGQPKSARKRKKKKKVSNNALKRENLLTLHELPKAVPLPPLGSLDSSMRPSSSSSESASSEQLPSGLRRPGGSAGPRVGAARHYSKLSSYTGNGNFDEMLGYLDGAIVSEWLQMANESVHALAQWIHQKDNFVQFAHFWLTDFRDVKKMEIFQLEHSILVDHLEFGFAAGKESGKLMRRDIVEFLSAVFREYPGKIMNSKGPHMFLDYLDILTSERTKSYKVLLSDVKCSTRNKQFAQLVLAIRCFALVSVWNAVLSFYRRLVGDTSSNDDDPLPEMSKLRPSNQRMYMAVRNGYLDVVHYLLLSGKIRTTFKDPNKRTLLFTAVMHNRPRILQFLLYNVRPTPDVNQAADTGNSALHAAAHCGYHEIAKILLEAPLVRKNPTNPNMDDATPLHLATLHGQESVVEVLLDAGVDITMKMGGLTAKDIANDFGQDKIAKLLCAYEENH